MFSQGPLEVIIAESTGGIKSTSGIGLSDNVVEMEISCSKRDENEFAEVISQFLHHSKEEEFVFEWAAKCFCFLTLLLFLKEMLIPYDRQVSALLSTPQDNSASFSLRREGEIPEKVCLVS